MNDDDGIATPIRTTPPRRTTLLAVATLVAFVLGVALAATAFRRSDRLAGLVHPQAPEVRIVDRPVPVPVVRAPPPDVAALGGRIDTLQERVDALDQRAVETGRDADRAEGLLLAFAARRALDRGQPLGFLEGLLRAHFGGVEPQAVATVIGAAQAPVTLTQLQERLTTLLPALGGERSGEGWLTAARREIGALFVVRRTDRPANDALARETRASRAMAAGQVDVALDEVAHLPGARAADAWMAQARRYVLARGALDRLETAALLAPPATPPLLAARAAP